MLLVTVQDEFGKPYERLIHNTFGVGSCGFRCKSSLIDRLVKSVGDVGEVSGNWVRTGFTDIAASHVGTGGSDRVPARITGLAGDLAPRGAVSFSLRAVTAFRAK